MKSSKLHTAIMQELESRRLRSASIDSAGTLVINGTNQGDYITVSLKSGDSSTVIVSDNGSASEFAKSSVTAGARIDGKNGDDWIAIDDANGDVELDVSVTGGNGMDTIHGGSADDSLEGGNGKDNLYGGGGDDHLAGQNGRDLVYGEDGDDVLHGENGRDILDGGDGDDDLNGGRAPDDITGGAGNDDFGANHGNEVHDRSAEDDGNNALSDLSDN